MCLSQAQETQSTPYFRWGLTGSLHNNINSFWLLSEIFVDKLHTRMCLKKFPLLVKHLIVTLSGIAKMQPVLKMLPGH